MPRNGSGIYTPVASPDFPAVAFTAIRSAAYNNQILDMAAALTASLTADGQKVPTANLPMGGKKHTGVANATVAAEYMALGQLSAAIAALTKLALGGTARVWEASTVALDLGTSGAVSVDPIGNVFITNNLRFVAPDWLHVTTAPASMLILDKVTGSFKFLTAVSATVGAAATLVERGSLSNLGVLALSSPLPLTSGGLGATTIAAARRNLGIFDGRVASNGTAMSLPPGWSSSRSGFGRYVVTHNLATAGYSVLAGSSEFENVLVAAPPGVSPANTFAVTVVTAAGVYVDSAFNFTLIKD